MRRTTARSGLAAGTWTVVPTLIPSVIPTLLVGAAAGHAATHRVLGRSRAATTPRGGIALDVLGIASVYVLVSWRYRAIREVRNGQLRARRAVAATIAAAIASEAEEAAVAAAHAATATPVRHLTLVRSAVSA